MNFSTLWQLLMMVVSAGMTMEALPVGGTVHTTDVGIPPASVIWRDGRRFTIALHIERTK